MVKQNPITLMDHIGLKNIPEKKFNEPVNENIANINEEVRKRFIGCFLGLAIGDAKGMPAESKSKDEADNVANTSEYLDGYLPAGHYTDDTNQAILLAESIIEKGEFNPDTFMKHMTKMDLTRGYGPTTMKSVLRYVNGTKAEESGLPSNGNGPSMRVAPLALVYHHDLDKLKKIVIQYAKCTHTLPEAVAGSLAVAFSIAYNLNNYNQPFDKENFRKELIKFIKPVSPEVAASLKKDSILMERYGCTVLESVPYAIKAFLENPLNYKKTINESIKGAGDADTIAAIAGSISGAINGVTGIPADWINNLENNDKGRDYIVYLAKKLYEISEQVSKEK